MKKIISLPVFMMLFSTPFLNAQTTNSAYHIANTFHLEGDGGWDYLTIDDSTGFLYVSHSTMVQVVDTKDGKLMGTISGLKGVHGIALARDLNKGFISNGKDSSVTVFNLKTLAVIEKITVTGQNPDAILYDPFTKRVFTFNGRSSNVTAIDAATDKIVGTIALDGKPEFSVTNNKGKIYVNIEDKSMINMIDPAALKVEQKWKIAPGEEASGLAIDKENQRLFIVCDNKLMIVMDAQTGKIITSLPIGDRVDGVSFDPINKRAYSSNGDGTLTVVQEKDANTFTVLENVPTQKGARTITVNTKNHHVYLPTAEFEAAPKPTAENPKPRPGVKANSMVILDIEPLK